MRRRWQRYLVNLGELLALARLRLDDLEEPYLWDDDFLIDSINRAEVEAAERSYLLKDRTMVLPYTAGQGEVTLDPAVLYVEQVTVAGMAKPLLATSVNELNLRSPDWAAGTAERPTCYAREDRQLVLIPTPTLDGELRLVVTRTPLKPMASDGDKPEIDSEHHEALLHFVCHQAYSHNDADGENYDRAKEYLAQFSALFRRRRMARFNRMNQDHVKNSTLYLRRFN
ncbi:MAG: hypothetical protein KAG66_00480 [Methylococcales bacterium]|nr:hypothetical protein [Methylococcales bacterium]